jgi:predicted metal-binding membrane protein
MVALAALYTVAGVGMEMSALDMTFGGDMNPAGGMAGMAMEAPGVWGATKFTLVFLMWWLMMIAMMLPSAAPTILLYTALLRRLPAETAPQVQTGAFMAGYLLIWAVFSLAATLAQGGLEATGLLLPSKMAPTDGVAGPLLVLAAGAYQFLPLKDRCLAQCRAPADFIARHHRPGILGAARVGLRHGAFCLGCCFALMMLLFAGGIMNLYWIFGLAALVALEKLVPRGRLISRAVGAVLLGSGVFGLGVAASS